MNFCKYERHGGYCARGNHKLCLLDCPDAEMIEVMEVVRCKDCEYCVPLDKHCEINNFYKHCTLWHGEEERNIWHKYKKYYKDYSIVVPDGFCSHGERKG